MSKSFLKILFLAALCFWSLFASAAETEAQPASAKASVSNSANVPVLTYHRLGPAVVDSMTLKTEVFESQLKWLKENGYTIIPLKTLVSYLQGKGPAPAPKSVVITFDDGHKSVYSDLLPLVRKYNFPVTLFIYPSAISNASYALTWPQLQEMQKMSQFDIQGHTYWHPNFHKDKKKLSPEEYAKFVDVQLVKSKTVLEKKLGIHVDILAWPFGIYDEELEEAAKKAGYVMAFSIDGRSTSPSENPMSQPRYMIVHELSQKDFEAIVVNHASHKIAEG